MDKTERRRNELRLTEQLVLALPLRTCISSRIGILTLCLDWITVLLARRGGESGALTGCPRNWGEGQYAPGDTVPERLEKDARGGGKNWGIIRIRCRRGSGTRRVMN
jgi:hypothetical protein